MKKIIVFLVLTIIVVISINYINKNNNLTVLQLTEELKIAEVEENVFLIAHSFPWEGNSLILVLDRKNILWIDVPYIPEATTSVLD